MSASSPNEEATRQLLRRLALDLRWSWNHAADELWSGIDSELWSRTHNPWVVLQTVTRARLAKLLEDERFRAQIQQLDSAARESREAPAWFQLAHREAPLSQIAYFSMEFMLSEALPIYAGGLGNVAGDQLKTASDLGVPVIGIGLLYQQGYFRQVIASDGSQRALFPYNDPGQLPVTPVRGPNGQLLRLELRLPGYSLWLRAWQVTVGRLRLYLLDSNDIANDPSYRGITSELYGGGSELRLQQELILGMGGWRLLAALGLEPQVCHLNEGHAALLVLERALAFMRSSGQPFAVALAVTRAGNVFTTHTAVPAGFDRFAPELIERYFTHYAQEQLHISLQDLLALGREHPDDRSEPFNMAYLAMRGSGVINGVSRLHAEVSRRIFQPLFPHWPTGQVPVAHVTNGVHVPSWDSAAADELWTGACGKRRWVGELESLETHLRTVDDARIWQCRSRSRAALVEYAREQLSRLLEASGGGADQVEAARHLFDPEALTLGFARRFATYKRPNLLLTDPERLVRLLTDSARPVQLILAGKAHPDDAPAQALVREWVQFVRRHDVRPHAVFLADYDMLLTEQLVQGVDVWINTPRRPWEACGTSGMKVLVNGGLNLSELDGWWAEAYRPEVGWAIGDGREHDSSAEWDRHEARQLLDLLEQQIVPEFYRRDEQGIPRSWVRRIRESMATLTPAYSANRSVREYVERCYLPAAANYRARAEHNGQLGWEIVNWRAALEYNWPALRFGPVSVRTQGQLHQFQVSLHLGALRPNAVAVELYADASSQAPPVRQPMQCLTVERESADHIYAGSVPASRPASDYTARVIPAHAVANVPLEAGQILWQR